MQVKSTVDAPFELWRAGLQEVQHTLRMMAKVILSHPIAAAQRVIELCRTFDNMGDIFVTFSQPLPLIIKEVLLTECLRVCLLRNVKALSPGQEQIAAVNHANVCSFLGKFVAANEQLDLYVAFLYVAQGMRAQEHPMDVLIIESVFQHSMGALLLLLGLHVQIHTVLVKLYRGAMQTRLMNLMIQFCEYLCIALVPCALAFMLSLGTADDRKQFIVWRDCFVWAQVTCSPK